MCLSCFPLIFNDFIVILPLKEGKTYIGLKPLHHLG